MKRFDISLKQKPKFRPEAKRIIFCGGERLRRLELWQNSIGEAHTLRIIYSDGKQE